MTAVTWSDQAASYAVKAKEYGQYGCRKVVACGTLIRSNSDITAEFLRATAHFADLFQTAGRQTVLCGNICKRFRPVADVLDYITIGTQIKGIREKPTPAKVLFCVATSMFALSFLGSIKGVDLAKYAATIGSKHPLLANMMTWDLNTVAVRVLSVAFFLAAQDAHKEWNTSKGKAETICYTLKGVNFAVMGLNGMQVPWQLSAVGAVAYSIGLSTYLWGEFKGGKA